MTILYGPWDPLAQALGDQGLRARYEKFEFLGGTGDIRVLYGRRDMMPGGIKAPADIVKAETVVLGSLNNTDISGLLPHLALRMLGIKHKLVVGYRGGNDVFLAMQRGEVNVHSTSITTFRGRNAPFVKSGTASASPIWSRSMAAAATRPASSSPRCRRSPISTSRCTARCRPARSGTR